MTALGPTHLSERTLGAAWLSYNRAVLSKSVTMIDDREDIHESGPVSLVIEHVDHNDPIIRRFGDPHVIEMYTEKMFSMEIIEELNSTYGDRIFSNNGVDQFEWMISRLKNKWWTKAASISLLKPNDPGPRIPCLTQLQMVIRNGALQIHSVFRSQNVFRSYGNFIGIQALQKIAAEKLEVTPGSIYSYCICPHIYHSDVPKVQAVLHDALGLDGEVY